MAKAAIKVGGEYSLQRLRPRSAQYNGRRVTVSAIDDDGCIRTTLLDKQPGEFSGFVVGANQLA